jgi:hypothetical protein
MAFAALALIFGLVKLYFGASQYLYPWQIQPHSTFIGEIHENDVSIWETISGFSFLACGTAIAWSLIFYYFFKVLGCLAFGRSTR